MKLAQRARWLPPFATEAQEVEAIPPAGYRPSWIEVDLTTLDHNLACLRSRIPAACSVMAVVKDNAYGHGMVAVARHLEGQVQMLGVAILEEAAILRRAGITCPIVVLGGLWGGQEREALHLQVTPVINSAEALQRWEEAAGSARLQAGYHLKVDTGMNRLGVPADHLSAFLDEAGGCPHTLCEGLMTHLASADSPDGAFTNMQLDRFRRCLQTVRGRGLEPRWVHVANSAGILDHPESHFNLVRPGIALYGYDPRPSSAGRGLRPVLTLKSRIGLLKEIPAGSAVGYGGSFVARHNMRLASVPIGYGDGYSRKWSNAGQVLIAGTRAPIVGRVSMDAITVDVTSIQEAQVGAEIVLLGKSGDEEIDAAGMAEHLGTISYEVLTSLSPRLARAYLTPKT